MFKKKVKSEPPKVTVLPKKEKKVEKKVEEKVDNPWTHPTVESMEGETKAAGKVSFVSYLKGEHLNLRESVEAMCYSCMGFYADGIADCGDKRCPLYPFHPYNPNPAKLRKERPDMRKKK